MSYHVFSLDPRTVLGVRADASPDEIREAYHAKSKKHHPDMGGDEWAFRMVARAYEVLKATSAAGSSQAWDHPGHARSTSPQEKRWSWPPSGCSSGTDYSAWGREGPRETVAGGSGQHSDENAEQESGAASQGMGEFRSEPDELRTVNVELIWTRYEGDSKGGFSSSQDVNDLTLSVCMVISWPPHSAVDRAAEFPSSGETLRALIELFGHLQSRNSVVATRSRIEDGQFVAWLSYPDVVAAGEAFLFVRETLRACGRIVELRTRDARLSAHHDDAIQEPVTAHAG